MPHLSFLRMLSRIPGRGILEAGLAGAFLLLAGCKTPLAEKPTPGEPEAPASERAPLDEAPLSVEKLNLERVTLKPPLRSGPAPAAPALESVYPKRLIPAMAEPDTKFPVRFNFDALSVQDIVPLFAAQLKFNFLIDPAVTGSVTMTLESELTAAELWTLLEHLLALSGAYASPHNGYIQILPVAKMPRESTLFTTAAPQPNVEVAFLPIGHLKSTELLEGLKPFLTENASVTPLPRLGAVMLVDTPVNVARIRELARRLDESSEAGWPLRTVQARHIDADVLREELQQVLPVIGFPVTDKASSDGELKITTIPRLQVLLISAALPEVVAEAARWAEFLDQENATEQEAIFFYNVRHSKADHLSEMLGVFFNTSGATSKSGTAAPSKSKAVSGRAGMKTPAEQETAARPAPAAGKPQGKREVGDKGTVFDAPVVIHADTDQNRLTILTTPRTYAMIEALLQRLDVPPRQVLIQADIANITLSESTKFGFSYAAMQKIGGWNGAWALNNTGAGVPGAATGTAAMALGTNAFAAVFRKDSDKIAFITAVAGDDKTHLLATPQILAKNDQEAKISIGQDIPIVNSDVNDAISTSTSTNMVRNYQYVTTGVIMTVTPHITAGNDVHLEIALEKSEGQANNLTGASTDPANPGQTNSSPIINKKELNTQCVIPDGATILMGGLIETTREKIRDGVPFLKDIPLIGMLFRVNTDISTRNELVVVLTVHVVNQNGNMDTLLKRYADTLKLIKEKRKP